jgi:uncharacterized protein (TIGR01777 family)
VQRTILISGASGLIGAALTVALERDGHRVRRLVRREAQSASEVQWNPGVAPFDPRALDEVDVVVNLAGETIGRRWTTARRRRILSSRLDSTGAIVTAIGKAARRPGTLINASAVGFYGDRGDDVLDEREPAGGGFLADVCQQWEEIARVAGDLGTRVVLMRSGVVLSKQGGALRQMLPPFRAGIGGRLGDGNQWMSWITLTDEVRAIIWLIEHPDVSGPVNLTAPNPVRNSEFTQAMGLELHRPTILPVPRIALKLLFGQMSEETLLVSQRAIPSVLSASGFQFECSTIGQALAQVR